jgi:hypothetical protein
MIVNVIGIPPELIQNVREFGYGHSAFLPGVSVAEGTVHITNVGDLNINP